MKINDVTIGPGRAPYIIAEMSANHCGDLERALRIIDEAEKAGCDAVKIQVYDPYRLSIARGGEDKVVKSGPWVGRKLIDLYTEGATHYDWLPELFDFADQIGITLFPSVFDIQSIDLLESLGSPAYKISSFDLTNKQLLEALKQTGKPLILSTGMASKAEIKEALKITGLFNVALLHCVSVYPCPIDQANLHRMQDLFEMANGFTAIGYSDHTNGVVAAISAAALGAEIIEKHFTLDDRQTLDSSFSICPLGMAGLVAGVRMAWAACQEAEAEDQLRSLRVTS